MVVTIFHSISYLTLVSMVIKRRRTGRSWQTVALKCLRYDSPMKNIAVFWFMLVIFIFAAPDMAVCGEDEAWVVMPAGAKPSYMGIHGGTMPVSLLVSADGASLFTFVGRTGNDFMEVLQKAHMPLPTFGNATWSSGNGRRSGHLFAGNATASLPVIALSGDALARLESTLQPFGLSDEPLSIEGEVVKPEAFPHAKSFRTFFLPDYFRMGDSK